MGKAPEPRTERHVTPRLSVAAAVVALRKEKGWTAADLAKECERLGMPSLNRPVIANIESNRRKYISVDELCCLAYALDVAPIHLLAPLARGDVSADRYQVTPDVFIPTTAARAWIKGDWCPPATDPRRYFANSQVPPEEFSKELQARSDLSREHRDIARRALGDRAKKPDTEAERG